MPRARLGAKMKKNTLHVGESNPGRLRDRQKCYQLHQHGLTVSEAVGASVRIFFFAQFISGPISSTRRLSKGMSYDHTTVTTPHPIRTAKLSTVGPNQYCSGGPCGKPGCRRAGQLFLILSSVFAMLGAADLGQKCTAAVLRSHHSDYTASRPNCEVKRCWARPVPQWGTMWEPRVS